MPCCTTHFVPPAAGDRDRQTCVTPEGELIRKGEFPNQLAMVLGTMPHALRTFRPLPDICNGAIRKAMADYAASTRSLPVSATHARI